MRYDRNAIYQFIYVITGVVLWPYLNEYVNNSDSYQYINVARLYESGYLSEAVNGYWSPLISWLLLPVLKTGWSAIHAFKMLQLTIGLLALRWSIRLADQFAASPRFREPFKWIMIPTLLGYAYLYLTADLLFFTLQLRLVLFLIEAPVWNNRRRALQFGVLGSLLYLSKAFGFPLFIAMVCCSVYYHRQHATFRWKWVAEGIVVFLTISSAWIFGISLKYGHFTVSEAAAFNATREVAPLPEQLVRLPVLYTNGIVPPVGSHALSASEEPMQAITLTPLRPWSDKSDRDHRFAVIKRNMLSIWYFDFRRQLGIIFLLFLLVLFMARRELLQAGDPLLFYPIALLLFTYAGYAMILYHARYSWICSALMMLLVSRLAEQLSKSEKRIIQNGAWMVLVIGLVLSVKRPIKELLFEKDRQVAGADFFAAIISPLKTLEATYAPDREVAAAAEDLRRLNGSFASRFSDTRERPPYYASLAVAERSGQRFYGQLDDTKPGALDSLRLYGVRYFLVWNASPDSCFGRPPVMVLENVRVFDLR